LQGPMKIPIQFSELGRLTVRGLRMDPENVMVKDAMSEVHRGVMTGRDASEEEAKRLWTVLKDKVLLELKGEKD
jgi:hypothetical protein